MRPSSSWLWAACAVALICACRRSPPPPSPEYEEAYRIHEKLYVSQLDEAYGSPQMDKAAELLKQVKTNSSDHEAAQKLLATIDLGRKELARQHAEDERRRSALRAPVAPGPAIDPAAIVAAALPPTDGGTDAGPPPDAGPGALDPFAPGASIGALNRELGGCLTGGEATFTEKGSSRLGQVYKISDSRYCQGKVPGLQGQALLVVNGRLWKRVPEKDLIVEQGAQPTAVTPGPAAPAPAAPGSTAGAPAAPPAPTSPPGGPPSVPQPPSPEYTGPKPEQPQPTY